jgi:Spy/CpxP family protein refolding chaperone
MNRLPTTILAAALALAAAAAVAQNDAAEAPEPEPTPPQEEIIITPDRSPETFRPSEQISEDLSVSFPVDI